MKAPTRDELLAAITEACGQQPMPPDDPGMTCQELAQAWGIQRAEANKRVQRGLASGKLLCGMRAIRTRAGYLRRVPVYRAA